MSVSYDEAVLENDNIDAVVPDTVFNRNKSDYTQPSLFLGEKVGLFDTVNKQYPNIWKLYKTMKSLDWDELEFDYTSCNVDFKTCNRSTYEIMIKTLAWQWEADSIASRISPLVGCFITSSELWAAWQRISDNEVVHAATYSEIVRNSFDNPSEILDEILSVEQAFGRLETVTEVMGDAHQVAHRYALGDISGDSQDTYEAIFMFTVAMLVLERVQFMASFAVTFSICDTGLFQPIGKAVQKIAQDELEVHVELDKEILRNELKTDKGKLAFENNRELIERMINEVVDCEFEWIDYLFSEGRELVGLNADVLKQWTLFCARDVFHFLKLNCDHKMPRHNPLKFMENWLDISKTQASPQEQDNAQYKVGIMRRDDSDENFDVDF